MALQPALHCGTVEGCGHIRVGSQSTSSRQQQAARCAASGLQLLQARLVLHGRLQRQLQLWVVCTGQLVWAVLQLLVCLCWACGD